MKKILISVTEVDIGGIDRSLLGLLDAIDYNEYEVDLFVYNHHGSMMNQINQNVNLLKENKIALASKESISFCIKHGHFLIALARILGKIISIIRRKKYNANFDVGMVYTNKFVNKYLIKKIKKHYDVALSFAGPHYFILDNVDADIKMGWIHTDLSSSYESFDVNFEKKMWSDLDYVVSISEKCKDSFAKIYPQLESKTIIIENCLSKKSIMKQTDEHIEDMNTDSIKLLSIGRFCDAKNFENIPSICKQIIENGYNVKWFIIGFGELENIIREQINACDMENNIIILGKKENPYPYILQCDLYVQPSRYEGKCVAVREAQLLNKPVVITNYNTAQNQLVDGVDGVIVPLENDGCAEGICSVLSNQTLIDELIENTKKNDYTNSSELQKIYDLIK